jgi:hypothetical protein
VCGDGSTQKADAGGDDLNGCNRQPASERRNRLKWFQLVLIGYVENQGNELKGPLSTYSPAGGVVPQGPVNFELLSSDLLARHLLLR